MVLVGGPKASRTLEGEKTHHGSNNPSQVRRLRTAWHKPLGTSRENPTDAARKYY